MNITVKSKNVELSDEIRKYGTNKITKLTRYFKNIQGATLNLILERGQSIAEITLMASGKMVRSEERGSDMYTAIDMAVESIETQIRRYKERLTSRSHPNEIIRGIPESAEESPEEEGEEKPLSQIVKTKIFPLRPMDELEAIEQMELLGHDFFLFLHSQNGQIGLLYRRKEGDLGLIIGEI